MKQCPETGILASVDELSGHVWVQELPTGGTVRFQVASSGLLTFAVGDRTYDAVESVPIQYRRAAQLINDRIDRAALQAAADEPGNVTFCGVATWNDGIEYEWSGVPAFVGVDVWAPSKDTFLSPDGATGVFERLGLPTLPAIEKEVSAATRILRGSMTTQLSPSRRGGQERQPGCCSGINPVAVSLYGGLRSQM